MHIAITCGRDSKQNTSKTELKMEYLKKHSNQEIIGTNSTTTTATDPSSYLQSILNTTAVEDVPVRDDVLRYFNGIFGNLLNLIELNEGCYCNDIRMETIIKLLKTRDKLYEKYTKIGKPPKHLPDKHVLEIAKCFDPYIECLAKMDRMGFKFMIMMFDRFKSVVNRKI
ncbi:hypothetical protein ACOME3_002519 [Neoechinorhynchus agilis]